MSFNTINLQNLSQHLAHLSRTGLLSVTSDKLFYLDINDDYINRIFPLFQTFHPNMIKAKKSIGAHISVVYPEENCLLPEDELTKQHSFEVTGAFSADLGQKRYYVLAVNIPSLIALRKQQNLSEKLRFKGQFIEPHITIGTEIIF